WLPPVPLPPRSLVIERFPASETLQDIIIERWLPYGPASERRTIVQPAPPAMKYPLPTHTIIIHDKAPARIVRKIEKAGVTQEDPEDYIRRYGSSLLDSAAVLERARQAGVIEDITCTCPQALVSTIGANQLSTCETNENNRVQIINQCGCSCGGRCRCAYRETCSTGMQGYSVAEASTSAQAYSITEASASAHRYYSSSETRRIDCNTSCLSCREASKIIRISKSSVQRAINCFEETGAFHDRRRSGRPKKLNDRNVRMLKRLTENDGRYSSREITNKLNNSLKNPHCKKKVFHGTKKGSERGHTVRSFLGFVEKRFRMKLLGKWKKWFRTHGSVQNLYQEKPQKFRTHGFVLNFPNHIHPMREPLEVMHGFRVERRAYGRFHNETTFYVIKRKNKVKIWRTKDEQWKEGCMEVAAIGGGGRVNFWGAIASEGTDNYLIPKVHLYQMENDFFYQHDNARYHVSRQVQTKLHELGIKLSEWSAKSPDLNAIKHLWSIIDDKLKSRSISSVNELTEALSTEWLSIKPELCYELVFTMSKKIQKCIANNGKYIHY
ncbi:unnamed protein product, partial [Rotaria magnacalcarata]